MYIVVRTSRLCVCSASERAKKKSARREKIKTFDDLRGEDVTNGVRGKRRKVKNAMRARNVYVMYGMYVL